MPRFLRMIRDRELSPLAMVALIAGALLTGLGCSGSEPVVHTPEPLIIEEAFELETEISFDESDADYLVVRPMMDALAVADNGDLLILDEDWVKVFAADGRPKMRFGGWGSGPGEFERVRSIWRSPSGFLTIFGGSMGFTAHYFRPDYAFIERIDYRGSPVYGAHLAEQGMRTERPQKIYRLDEDRLVYMVKTLPVGPGERGRDQFFYFLQRGNQVEEIARYPDTGTIRVEGMGHGSSTLGWPLLAALSSEVIAFAHTREDDDPNGSPPTYSIRLLDLASGEERRITHPYRPVLNRWRPREYSEGYLERLPPDQRRMQEALDEAVAKYHAENPYYFGLSSIHGDGDRLFARTYLRRGEEQGTLVDVFDVRTCQYIASGWFQGGMNVVFQDGFVHVMSQFEGREGPFWLRKYRIHPQFYERH